MKFEGEKPRSNRQRGPGSWMDLNGAWRAPEEWPEDYPPLAGWVRNPDGGWLPPRSAPDGPTRWSRLSDQQPEPEPATAKGKESRQARADKKAMLTVTGVFAAIALVITGAVALIAQASADTDSVTPASSDVIFAAETEQALAAQRRTVASEQPAIARTDLAALPTQVGPVDPPVYDAADWLRVEDGCLSVAEKVLIERSRVPVTYVDQLECVPDEGEWVDRAHGNTVRRVVDAEMVSIVPRAVAHASGGWAWSPETKSAFASDLSHPATLQVVAAGFGHNPRSQDPSAWKPAARAQWCAYSVDWIAVKTRWGLAVTAQERSALAAMLDTCTEPSSAGADPGTVLLTELELPTITR